MCPVRCLLYAARIVFCRKLNVIVIIASYPRRKMIGEATRRRKMIRPALISISSFDFDWDFGDRNRRIERAANTTIEPVRFPCPAHIAYKIQQNLHDQPSWSPVWLLLINSPKTAGSMNKGVLQETYTCCKLHEKLPTSRKTLPCPTLNTTLWQLQWDKVCWLT